MRRRKAFTLIELLVVTGVITLLLAMLLPALEKTRNQAYTIKCQSNLRQWGSVFESYADEIIPTIFIRDGLSCFEWMLDVWYGGRIIHSFSPDDRTERVTYSVGPSHISNYVKRIRFCPMATELKDKTSTVWRSGGTFNAWGECWSSDEIEVDFRGSYGLNLWLLGMPNETMPTKNFWDNPDVKNPANVPVLFDCIGSVPRPYDTDEPPPYEDTYTAGSHMQSVCINRHDGGVNSLFLDWSVRKVGLKELWTLKWHKEFNRASEWTKAGGVQPSDWPEWMRKFTNY